MKEHPGLDAVLVLLSDQPLLDLGDLERLLNHHRSRQSVATFALHGQRPGVPAVFSKEAFPALNRLEGDQGARKLVYLEGFEYGTVPFRSPDFDIDTPEDLRELQDMEKKKIAIEVKYFGVLAESAGLSKEVVEVSPGTTAGELRDLCSDLHRFSDLGSIQVAVNQRIDSGTELKGGDEVALLPPFAGG
jgi:molybdopterin converting factor small subunit